MGLLQQRYGRHIGFRERRFGADRLEHCWESRNSGFLNVRATDIRNLELPGNTVSRLTAPARLGLATSALCSGVGNTDSQLADFMRKRRGDVIQLRRDGTLNLGAQTSATTTWVAETSVATTSVAGMAAEFQFQIRLNNFGFWKRQQQAFNLGFTETRVRVDRPCTTLALGTSAATTTASANIGNSNIGFGNTGTGNIGIEPPATIQVGLGALNSGGGSIGFFNSGEAAASASSIGPAETSASAAPSNYNTGLGNWATPTRAIQHRQRQHWNRQRRLLTQAATTPAGNTGDLSGQRQRDNLGDLNTGWGSVATLTPASPDLGQLQQRHTVEGDYQEMIGYSDTLSIAIPPRRRSEWYRSVWCRILLALVTSVEA